MVTKRWHWNDETRELQIFCRESQTVIWSMTFGNFENAQDCAESFCEIYNQGVRHGKQSTLEEVRRTVDHIDRNI